jgi:Ser/Thr protein kinase RdoA (MazF antagonist)
MNERTQQEVLIAAALRRLGQDLAPSTTVRLLAGGRSGSSVYHLDRAGQGSVLKVTLPDADRQGMTRARREVRFYRDLAMRVPVLVPRLLGVDFDTRAGVVMLFTAYEPSPSPDRWPECDYTGVAHQLGRFHATFWERSAVASLPGWLRPKPRPTLAQSRTAARQWRALSERDDLRPMLQPYLRKLERLVMSVPALERRFVTLPATLCHGDCHTGNLLRNPDGEWVWADWQDVRLGPGVDDLSFLWQRAFAAADRPPPDDVMVQAYDAGLESVLGTRVPRAELGRNLAWAELRSWLVDWPAYLGALPTIRIERVIQRIVALIDHFQAPGER